jgi:concentrative nucleoside transporter, CNT family
VTQRDRLGRLWRTWSFFILCGAVGYFSTTLFAGTPAPAAKSETSAASAAPAPAPIDLKSQTSGATMGQRAMSFCGIFILLGLCWCMSDNRRKINWKLVGWGLFLQVAFGVAILKTAPGLWIFDRLNTGTVALLGFTEQGSAFLFRSFVTGQVENGFVNFTFKVLPTIIFFSSLMTVGYHVGVMQKVVDVFSVVMQKTMKCSGAETLSTAANIFVGQTEAPLVVKPYIEKMTNSELLAVMAGGFANTAGGVLAAYVGMLHQYFPDIAGHLIAQSVMSAPAALVCAKIVMPELGKPVTSGYVKMGSEKIDANVIDAASRGATEGLQLAFNVAAMLLAFIALIGLGNGLLKWAGASLGYPQVSLESLLGILGWPLAWAMGVPTSECWTVGQLIGVKTVINEFVAYLQMADLMAKGQLSPRAAIICSYALSGFANFSSIAIQIGGISAIAPSRRHDLAKLGFKAMVTGAIATFMTATIAGCLIG